MPKNDDFDQDDLLEDLEDETIDDIVDIEKSTDLIDGIEDEFGDLDLNLAKKNKKHTELEEILYKIPKVKEPLIGSPRIVQEKLDNMALIIQKDIHSKIAEEYYNVIHLYMHNYLVGVALKKFPYIRGMQTVDVYQEALIALRFKAIPSFCTGKGMSFLNFAKMCINRHLITILNASLNRLKDQPMNQAVSIDSQINDDSDVTFANFIHDNEDGVDEVMAKKEAFHVTKIKLMSQLSDFEKIVLHEYLESSSYKEIAKNIFDKTLLKKIGEKRATKAVDNALLRIRTKAIVLIETEHVDLLPLFIV